MRKPVSRYILVAVMVLNSVSIFGQDWVSSTVFEDAAKGFVASKEADGSPVYIIRAPFEGGVTPGKFSPRRQEASISWGGRENTVLSFELFIGQAEWKKFEPDGALPDGAVIGGAEADGTPLYIIRGRIGALQVPGKYNGNSGLAYVPLNGREETVESIEILVRSAVSAAPVAEVWVSTDVSDSASRARPAGKSPDGTPSFLIRALFQGSLIPGKFNPKAKTAYVPWGGKENPVKNFELYIGPQLWLTPESRGTLPVNALAAGKESDGTLLYAIRAASGAALVPGKFNPKTREAYISIGGKEVKVDSYEFLVREASVATPPAATTIVVGPTVTTTSASPDPLVWLPPNAKSPPARSVVFAATERSSLFLVRGTLNGNPATGYLDPMTMQAFLLGENGPVATSAYEVWGGGGWWAEVDSYSIPSAALTAGLPDRGRKVPLVRVRSGSRVLPAFYSEVDGTIIAYDGGKRTEFRKGEVLMPDWAWQPLSVEESVRLFVTENQGKRLVPYRMPSGREMSVGKYVLDQNVGYISAEGREISYGDFLGEIFIGTGVWVRPVRASVPDNAIPAGRDATGAVTYAIKATYMNDTALGQYNDRLGIATIPYGGKEVRVTDFEVLCYPPLTAPPVSLSDSSQALSATVTWGAWPSTKTGLPFVRPSQTKSRPIVPSVGFWSGADDSTRNAGVGDYGKVQVFTFEGTKNETVTLTLESGDVTPGFYLIAPSGIWIEHEPMLDPSGEAYISGSYGATTVLPETGTYSLLVNHPQLASFRLRFEGKSLPGTLDTKSQASTPFLASEDATYSFRVVADGFSPVVEVLDATTKAVLATSFELYDNGRATVTVVYLKAGRSVIVVTRPVKGKTAAGARYLLNARLEFLGAGS